ncbi:MAG: PAS domain-containing protein [Candidatus Obscuribacterales bacterium]
MQESDPIDKIAEVVCALGDSGEILSINQACDKRWGYEPSELIGKPFISLLAPEDVPPVLEAMETARRDDESASSSFTAKISCKDGSIERVMWTIARSGSAIYLVSHHSSIPETLDLIKAHEWRLRTIVNNIVVGLFIVGERGDIESMNHRAEDIFARKPENTVGLHLKELFEEKARAMDDVLFMERLFSFGLNQNCQCICVRSGGDEFGCLVSLSEIRTHEGLRYIVHVVDLSQDIERPFINGN